MNLRRFLYLLLVLPSLVQAEMTSLDRRIEIGERATGTFDPRQAFGAGIDGHWQGESLRMLSPESVKQMLGAGLGPVSIRLRTELAIDAWHWNPKGSWSDPKHSQGYWSSDPKPDPRHPILLSYGYKLPRRGNTIDEANDDGYSRLDDGNPSTFWKSNPYLAKPFTGEADSHHPQWVVLDFGKPVPVNAIRIQWAEPFATRFRVEYSTQGRVYFGGHPWNLLSPVWKTFSHGVIRSGKGGDQFLTFGKHPVSARYLRIWMTEGSDTAPIGSTDPRDRLGYAIREISAGEAGRFDFDDHVIHSPGKGQTITYASSTDPWHRDCDLDMKVEQPGIDLMERSGITRGLPVMLAAPVLYDTPENAAALVDYVNRAGYRVNRVEMGEEPDGQRVSPSDFGALYAQTARLIRKAVPHAVMGGPSFVTVDVDRNDDTYRFDKRWWIRDFLGELRRKGQAGDFQFLSFEWYPFDDVDGKESEQLPRACGMLERAMRLLRSPGMPRVPLLIGEFNYSVFPCRQEVDLSGALLNAETAAQFLCGGGDAAYYYGYEPNKLEESGGSWGNQLMLLQREDQKNPGAAVPVATYNALRLLSGDWLDPSGGRHAVLPVRISGDQERLLSAFAVKRPDDTRSLLVINKDAKSPVRLSLKGLGKQSATLTTYSSKEYSWHPDGEGGHPSRNLPPTTQKVSADQPINIPPWSICVIK
jgi:hypothetical protein